MIAPGVASSDFKDGPYWINKTKRYSTTSLSVVDVAINSDLESYVAATEANRPFVLKYDLNGVLKWQKRFDNGTNPHILNKIACDNLGNAYITGRYSTTTSASPNELFVVKIDTNGNVAWDRRIRTTVSSQNSLGNSIAATSSYVVAAGASSAGILIVKYNSSGTLLWQRLLANVRTTHTASVIVLDASDNIYLAGRYNTGTKNYPYVVKLDSNGNILWQRRIADGTTSQHEALTDPAFAIDLSGNLILGYRATYTYPTPPSGSQTLTNLSLVKMSESGTILNQSILYNSTIFDSGTEIRKLEASKVSGDSSTFVALQQSSFQNSQIIKVGNDLLGVTSRVITPNADNTFNRRIGLISIDTDQLNDVYFSATFDIDPTGTFAPIIINGKLPSSLDAINKYIIDYTLGNDTTDINVLNSAASFVQVPNANNFAISSTTTDFSTSTPSYASISINLPISDTQYPFTQRSFE